MFKHILLAYDGSDHARRAAQVAAECARTHGAVVRVVCAVEPIAADLGEPNFSRVAGERRLAGERCVEEARQLIGEGVDVHTEVLFGPAAAEIITVAEVRGCDLIIMGSRGLGGLRGLLLGSHTQRVISHAHCPVLVVR
ncbi:MAG: universal stress protein [Chloroflexi bacterium]|nr:universal stress protein [Chloroflexota bacterium]